MVSENETTEFTTTAQEPVAEELSSPAVVLESAEAAVSVPEATDEVAVESTDTVVQPVETAVKEPLSPDSFAVRVRNYRARFKIKQEDLAKLVDVSQPTLSIIESGHIPRKKVQEKLNALLASDTPPEIPE